MRSLDFAGKAVPGHVSLPQELLMWLTLAELW